MCSQRIVAVVLLAFSVALSEACSCYYFHPQEHYCTADFVALVTVRREGKRPAGESTWMRSYHVKVHKLFKANKASVEGLSRGLIWTPPNDGLCGITLQRNKRYLLTGSGGLKPQVQFCNYHEEWSSLSRKQKKGFQRLYRHGCNCTVRVYHPGRGTQCLWDTAFSHPESHDCQSRHAVCVPSHGKQGCTWLGGQLYRDCMKKRRRDREP